jgi:deazaflavin-dependent oxidoreductase (nitroreductase family)
MEESMDNEQLGTYLNPSAKVNELQQLPEVIQKALDDHCELYKRDPEAAHIWDPIVIGVPGGPVKNLMLTYTGRKTGRTLHTVLQYYEREGKYAVIGSRGGTEGHPAWYLNLLSHPRCEIQVARQHFHAVARTLGDDDHARWWPSIVAEQPQQAVYQARTSRRIPIVVLDLVE